MALKRADGAWRAWRPGILLGGPQWASSNQQIASHWISWIAKLPYDWVLQLLVLNLQPPTEIWVKTAYRPNSVKTSSARKPHLLGTVMFSSTPLDKHPFWMDSPVRFSKENGFSRHLSPNYRSISLIVICSYPSIIIMNIVGFIYEEICQKQGNIICHLWFFIGFGCILKWVNYLQPKLPGTVR